MEARYEERIRACTSEAELAEYLLSCVPVLKEYTKEVEETTTVQTKKVAGVQISSRKGVQRNDIYKKYLKEVEDGYEYVTPDKDIHEKPCRQCGAMYSRVFDESASEEICRECGATEYILGDEVGFKEEQDLEKHIV